MPLSTAEFWRLAIDSDLLSADDTISLSEAFGRVKGAERTQNAKTLGQWLVGENVLSDYQVRVLLLGQSGTFLFADYKVYDRVSSGRFTGWFRAIHATSHHPVLLEFVEPRVVADFAAWHRVQSLSRQIAGVESPYVLPLHELVETGRHKFLVYDDPGGQTVAQHMATHGRLAAGAACSIAREAAQALAALHAAGVVHGRVRPQNIIMGQTGTAILIVDPLAATDSEEFEIAADYAAPELAAAGAQPTQLTDIYALGSTLYQMLTGDVPFAGGDATQKLSRHATERIKPLDQIAGASLPLANPLPLTNVVAYAMAKDTSLRYADARALAEALRPFTEQNSTPANSANRPTSAAFQQATADRRASFLSSKPTAAQPAPSGMPQMPNVVQAIPASQVSSPSVAPNALQPNAARATNDSSAIPIALAVPKPASPSSAADLEERKAIVLAASRRRRIKQRVTLAASMLFIVVLAGYLLSRDVGDPQAAQNDPNAKQNENDQPDKIVEDDADGAPATDGGRQGTIADDGRTTWARPTAGKPISLKYVSGESHAYVYMRPQSLLSTTDGRQAFAALGPTADWLRKQVRQAVGVPLQQIDRLTVALAGTPSGWPESSLVVELRKPRSNWLVDLGNPSKAQHAGETYYLGSQWAYYFPKTKANRILVAAPIEKIKAIIDERAKPTIPRRLSMRKLLAKTDSRQHITVLAEPNFLFSDGREMFADHARKLLDPLRAFITRDLNATMLSIFVNDYDFYFEVRLVPGSQRNAYSIQKDLTKRLENLGDDVEQYVAALKPQAFGNQLVQRLPTAVRQVVSSDRMRTSVDDGQFLLNTYLPSYAAAHLLLASELALAETPGGSSQPTGPTKPTTLAEQLKMPLTLVFDQMAFGDVVKELVNQSGAKIEVLGKDLEGDGITRNKEIRDFKMDKKPLHEMLVLLCMKNNPIPGIKLASDPNQKLVYVFGPSPTDGKDVILITTRKAAATKGYKLPAVFGSKG